jgi:hypothetical protein
LIKNTVYDAGSNNNGRIDPGETVDLTTTLINMGGAPLNNLTTTITTSDPNFNIVDNFGFFGALGIDSIRENTGDPYIISATPSAPEGHTGFFNLIATDAGFAETIDFEITIGQPVATDTGYYYVYYSGGPHLESPVFNWMAIDTTQSVYQGTSLDLLDNQTVTRNLPFTFKYYSTNYNQVSICSNGWIAMGTTTSTDWTNSSIPGADGPPAMIAGLWDDLDPGNIDLPSDIYTYYDEINHRFIVEYFRVEHYPGDFYENFEIILLDPAYHPTPTGDGEIIVQYLTAMQEYDNTLGIESPSQSFGIEYFCNGTYHANAVPIIDGFALRYTTYEPGQTGIDEYTMPEPVNSALSLQISPNPFSKLIKLSFSIGQSAERIGLNVYDASGRLVKSFRITPGALRTTLSWDGCDDFGRRLPNGIYFACLENKDNTVTAKIILVD